MLAISSRAGETIPIVVERDGERRSYQVGVEERDGRGLIGAVARPNIVSAPLGRAVVDGMKRPAQLIALRLKAAVTPRTRTLSGPIAIARLSRDAVTVAAFARAGGLMSLPGIPALSILTYATRPTREGARSELR